MVKEQAEEERARRVDMEKSPEWHSDAQVTVMSVYSNLRARLILQILCSQYVADRLV